MIKNIQYRESLQNILDAIEVNDKTFLITGASGLIGSCLIDLLMHANAGGKHNHVYAVGRSKEKLGKRFVEFKDSKYFHIIEQNVCNPFDDNLHFDYIIHGASNADPVSYATYPVETMTTNIIGAYNILEYGRKHTKCKITILSTFEVYGNTGQDEYVETDNGIIDFNAFRACYPESKRSVEIMSRCYVSEYDVKVNVARLSSIYGPTMLENDSKAHAQFLHKALEGKDIILKSKGAQKRSYTYVIDAVTGILAVLFRGDIMESYNVSNENAIASIAEVAHICANLAGTNVVYDLPSDIEAKGFSKPQNCILNNKKLRDLGWRGQYSVETGFRRCYDILSHNM